MREIRVRSAMPFYAAAAVFALYGWFFPLLDMRHLLMAIATSVVAYFVSGKFFKDEIISVPEEARTGDADLDAQLRASRESLLSLKKANDAIDEVVVSGMIDRMEWAGDKILKTVSEKPERAGQVRRFMSYYLPVSAKLLGQYQELVAGGASGENAGKAKKNIEDSLGMIATAFEKQLDNLYKDEVMDISTDIQVLEKMMTGDGLVEGQGALKPESKGGV